MTQEVRTTNHGSTLRQARAMWKRRKWLALPVFLATVSVVTSLIMAMPDLYRAEATVLVRQDQAPAAAGPSAAGELESRLESINEEILSRSRLQDLIARFDLYPELRQRVPPEAVIERMRRDIRLERKTVETRWGQGATVAFTLSYQGWDPRTAAQVANTLASAYVAENEKLRQRQITVIPATGVDVLAQMKHELAELQAQFSERYPDVIRLKAEIAALERQRGGSGRAGAVTSPSPAQTSDLESKRRSGQQFQILDRALPPEEPVAPGRVRLMLMGLILACGMAGFAVLLAEQFDTSFHRLDELWGFTNLPILASIPRIVTRADAWRHRLRFGLVSLLTVSAVALLARASYFLGQHGEQLVWLLAQRGT